MEINFTIEQIQNNLLSLPAPPTPLSSFLPVWRKGSEFVRCLQHR